MIDADTLRTFIMVTYISLMLAVCMDERLRWRDRATIIIFSGVCALLFIIFVLPDEPDLLPGEPGAISSI